MVGCVVLGVVLRTLVTKQERVDSSDPEGMINMVNKLMII